MSSAPLLSPRENITTLIYKQIKNDLMTGVYAPGDVLTLRILVEKMGFSQTPIREALLQLVSERALSMERGRSITVPVFDRKRLQELRAIRLKLEVMAAEAAVANITDEVIARLKAVHDALVESKRNQDRTNTLRLNFEFHSTLYAACDMPDLIAIIEGLWAQTGPYLTFLYQPPFYESEGPHPHELVIAGLEARDTEAVVRAVTKDVSEYGAALMSRLPKDMH